MPERQELNGWGQIAEHLGVSIRAAQVYERKQRLPIHRLPGPMGRVWALTEELDAWKAGNPPENAKQGHPSQALSNGPIAVRTSPRTRRAILYGLAVVALLVVVGLALYAGYVPHGPPADLYVQGKNLVVINHKGQELWRHAFSSDFWPDHYNAHNKPEHAWLGSLNGDSERELLFSLKPINWAEVGCPLMCFWADGKLKWQFVPTRTVTDVDGDQILPPYCVASVGVIPGKTSKETRVVVSSHHHLSHANQVALLDRHGTVVGEYWHPGHLMHMRHVDLDGDGKEEVLLAGVNNGNHQATLVVLDPWQITGLETPVVMEDQRFRLLGMAPAKEKAVVLFPRSCLSIGQSYTRATGLRVTRDRIIVEVAESPEPNDPGFVYELDYNLRVMNVIPAGDNVHTRHRELEAKGKLDHAYTSDELEELKATVIVKRVK